MSTHVLVVNAGSSSLKYSLVDAGTGPSLASGMVERIGEPTGILTHTGPDGLAHRTRAAPSRRTRRPCGLPWRRSPTHGPSLAETPIAAVGHRVVHGGDRFAEPAVVDDALSPR